METPLVQKVAEQIRTDIAAERYAPEECLGPERLLCTKYGVSRSVLRAAIANLVQGGFVRKQKHRGAQVAPNVRTHLNSSIKAKSRMIILQMWNFGGAEMDIVAGARKFASEHGHVEPVVINALVNAGVSYDRCRDAIEQFSSRTDGFFTRVYPYYQDAVKIAIANGQSVVEWGCRNPLPEHSTIAVDEFAGGYSATDHLIKMHDLPAYYLGYDAPHGATRDRYNGWKAAMVDHGFSDYKKYFLCVELTEDTVVTDYDKSRLEEYNVMLKFFKASSEKKLCIFATGDFTATSVYKAAKDAGLNVGKDVFVVGHHDRPLCKRILPSLSSVSYSAESIGYEGARLLYEHMAGKLTQPVHKILPVKLQVRRSSVPEKENITLAQEVGTLGAYNQL